MVDQNRKRYRFTFSSLNTQLFFFVILPISLLLLAITFGSVMLHQDAMRNLVGERDQRTVRSAASAIREQLNHRGSAIQGIGIRVEDQADYQKILDSMGFLTPDFDAGIAFISTDGKVLAFTGDEQLFGEISEHIVNDLTGQPLLTKDSPHFSDAFYNSAQDEYFTYVYFQAEEHGPVGVGVFSVTNLARQTLSGILSPENSSAVVLVDKKDNLLYRSGNLDLSENPKEHPGVADALLGDSGTTYFMADDGEHVVAFSPVMPTNWALVVEEPWDAVASPMLRYSETGSLVLIPIVIFSLFALWFGTRKIIQPLNKLQTQAIAFSQGNYQAFRQPVGGLSEIQTLQITFMEMAEEVQKAQQTLKNFLGMITTSQEDERKRLARELHDETLQSLIALNQRIMMVKRQAQLDAVQRALGEIESMIAQTMQELRRLTRALRPIYLEELGLVAALDTLASEMSETAQIPVQFTTKGKETRLPDHVEIAIFRITQEALSNIMRHAEASHATLKIKFEPNKIAITIADDGKGFTLTKNLSDLSKEGHFGLLGIYERAELIGAKIDLQSNPNQGTKITLNYFQPHNTPI